MRQEKEMSLESLVKRLHIRARFWELYACIILTQAIFGLLAEGHLYKNPVFCATLATEAFVVPLLVLCITEKAVKNK
jgi:hypothetical protein